MLKEVSDWWWWWCLERSVVVGRSNDWSVDCVGSFHLVPGRCWWWCWWLAHGHGFAGDWWWRGSRFFQLICWIVSKLNCWIVYELNCWIVEFLNSWIQEFLERLRINTISPIVPILLKWIRNRSNGLIKRKRRTLEGLQIRPHHLHVLYLPTHIHSSFPSRYPKCSQTVPSFHRRIQSTCYSYTFDEKTSIQDISNLIKSLPERQRHKELFALHSILANKCLEQFKSRLLNKVIPLVSLHHHIHSRNKPFLQDMTTSATRSPSGYFIETIMCREKLVKDIEAMLRQDIKYVYWYFF